MPLIHKDLSGERFGRVILKEKVESINYRIRYSCLCDCGNIKVIDLASLKSGATRSCGCLHSETARNLKYKHGMTGGRPYRIWDNMVRRCKNKGASKYKNYGGRGISVSEEWKVFSNFWEDMKIGYSDYLTLDRINNDGNYCKENCRWATTKTQANNTSRNHRIYFKGKSLTLSEWSAVKNISVRAIIGRIKRGWTIEQALTFPLLIGGRKKLNLENGLR